MRHTILNKFMFAAAVLGLGIAAAATGDTVSASDAVIVKKLTHEIRMYPRYSIFDNIGFLVAACRGREQWGEELHLLYVALTRARDTLVLTAAVTEKKWGSLWLKPGAITIQAIVSAKSYADWLGLWFAQYTGGTKATATEGELPHLRWRIASDAELRDDSICRSGGDEAQTKDQSETPQVVSYKNTIELDAATAERLRAILSWKYPFAAATQRAAKSSVTALRRQAAEELDDEAEPTFPMRNFAPAARRNSRTKLSAADAGTAHHKFLQFVAQDNANDVAALKSEMNRLEREKVLSAGELAVLNLEDIAGFLNSAPGRKSRPHSP